MSEWYVKERFVRIVEAFVKRHTQQLPCDTAARSRPHEGGERAAGSRQGSIPLPLSRENPSRAAAAVTETAPQTGDSRM